MVLVLGDDRRDPLPHGLVCLAASFARFDRSLDGKCPILTGMIGARTCIDGSVGPLRPHDACDERKLGITRVSRHLPTTLRGKDEGGGLEACVAVAVRDLCTKGRSLSVQSSPLNLQRPYDSLTAPPGELHRHGAIAHHGAWAVRLKPNDSVWPECRPQPTVAVIVRARGFPRRGRTVGKSWLTGGGNRGAVRQDEERPTKHKSGGTLFQGVLPDMILPRASTLSIPT
jgi:hypothetical protein